MNQIVQKLAPPYLLPERFYQKIKKKEAKGAWPLLAPFSVFSHFFIWAYTPRN